MAIQIDDDSGGHGGCGSIVGLFADTFACYQSMLVIALVVLYSSLGVVILLSSISISMGYVDFMCGELLRSSC